MTTWWVGGYSPDMDGTIPGILALRTTDAGALALVGTAVEALSPSYLLQRGDRVYAVAEGAGTVDSFRRTGEFTLERDGSASSGGRWPCSLEFFDGSVVVANYDTGNLGRVGLDAGAVTGLLDTAQLAGSGPHERQEGPHAHAVLAVDDCALLSVDLGSDRVTAHRRGLGALASVALPPGTGPRDIARLPSGLFCVLSELSNELFLVRWTGSALEVVHSVLVPGARPGDQGSGISVWGDYVYTGIRVADRIARLRVVGETIEPLGWVSSEGEWPRHHAVHDGVLHVAQQLSNSVASFRLGDDGTPALIAEPISVPSPNYLLRAG